MIEAPTYVYGGTVYQRVSGPDAPALSDRVCLATCLTQGAITGAVLMFLFTSVTVLFYPILEDSVNTYDILASSLAWGVGIGLVEGLVIWICTRVAGHNLRWFTRALIGGLVLAIPYAVVLFIALSYLHYDGSIILYMMVVTFVSAIGAIFGVFTGWRRY